MWAVPQARPPLVLQYHFQFQSQCHATPLRALPIKEGPRESAHIRNHKPKPFVPHGLHYCIPCFVLARRHRLGHRSAIRCSCTGHTRGLDGYGGTVWDGRECGGATRQEPGLGLVIGPVAGQNPRDPKLGQDPLGDFTPGELLTQSFRLFF